MKWIWTHKLPNPFPESNQILISFARCHSRRPKPCSPSNITQYPPRLRRERSSLSGFGFCENGFNRVLFLPHAAFNLSLFCRLPVCPSARLPRSQCVDTVNHVYPFLATKPTTCYSMGEDKPAGQSGQMQWRVSLSRVNDSALWTSNSTWLCLMQRGAV
jgi:hypothetical protein